MPRERLAGRRHTVRERMEWGGHVVYVEAGFGNDGAVRECFFRGGSKVGSEVDSSLDDSAILISICLQHGCPLTTVAAAMGRDYRNEPTSVTGAAVDCLMRIVKEEGLR